MTARTLLASLLVLGALLSLSNAETFAAPGASLPTYKMEVTPVDGVIDPKISARYSQTLEQCEKSAQNTPDRNVCIEDEFRVQDAKLNEVWRKTLARSPKSAIEPLRTSQRRWVERRNPFCLEESGGADGGTIGPSLYSNCRLELTVRRTMWLESLPK